MWYKFRIKQVLPNTLNTSSISNEEIQKQIRRKLNNSSAFDYVFYNPKSKIMRIQFKATKNVYEYKDVPPRIILNLINAPSPGRYFSNEVRGKFEAVLYKESPESKQKRLERESRKQSANSASKSIKDITVPNEDFFDGLWQQLNDIIPDPFEKRVLKLDGELKEQAIVASVKDTLFVKYIQEVANSKEISSSQAVPLDMILEEFTELVKEYNMAAKAFNSAVKQVRDAWFILNGARNDIMGTNEDDSIVQNLQEAIENIQQSIQAK